MAVNHADGWQAKKVSQEIRDRRQDAFKKDWDRSNKTQAAKTLEKMNATKIGREIKGPAQTAQLDQKTKVRDPHLITRQPRPETQDQAARHDVRASEQFLKVQQDARNLRHLESKAPLTKSGDSAATNQAVTQKGEAKGPNVTRQGAQQSSFILAGQSAQTVQREAASQNAARHILSSRKAIQTGEDAVREKTQAEKPLQPDVKKNAVMDEHAVQGAPTKVQGGAPTRLTGEKSARADDTKDTTKSEKKEDEGGGEARASGGIYAAKSGAGKELGALLGGFSGGGGETGGETTPQEVSQVEQKGELPTLHPDFVAFNEFDESNPGVEVAKSKSLILDKLVLKKRLIEIGDLDRELDGRIRDIFETKKLSERIIGELKDELKAADFQRSVYGGLIG